MSCGRGAMRVPLQIFVPSPKLPASSLGAPGTQGARGAGRNCGHGAMRIPLQIFVAVAKASSLMTWSAWIQVGTGTQGGGARGGAGRKQCYEHHQSGRGRDCEVRAAHLQSAPSKSSRSVLIEGVAVALGAQARENGEREVRRERCWGSITRATNGLPAGAPHSRSAGVASFVTRQRRVSRARRAGGGGAVA
ncbi:hypothetical protein EDB84DRAFT_1446891 [Lactarius hengduanensis]|nr:hypothetical protein EDB84DRAFT_1446891 [Lactarius hengduanensis]